MDNSISNDLHDALLNKSNNQFWKIWKSRFGSERAENYIVSGMVDPVRILKPLLNISVICVSLARMKLTLNYATSSTTDL